MGTAHHESMSATHHPDTPPPTASTTPTAAPGLSTAEAALRLRQDGPNELGHDNRRTLLTLVLDVVREPMFGLLIAAAAIYATLGDLHEAGVLLGFVLIIMGVTVLQERRTDRALDALRDLSSPHARVRRGGQVLRIPAREVVRGDVLWVNEGDRVPADGRLLQAHELATDESMLTGESLPVSKSVGDRLQAGTLLTSGQGEIEVDATGGRTEFGRIGASLQDIALQASPMRDDLARLTRVLVTIGLSLCVLLFGLLWRLQGDWLQALLAGITLAMSVLPQEFPVIMIVFLALAARRLAAHQVLTRRLSAIETLGQTSVLAVDKTGTLTENRMAVAVLAVDGAQVDLRRSGDAPLPEAFHELLEFALLASEIDPHDPMEQAVHRLAARALADSEHLHPDWALTREYELSPQLLAMSHLWRGAGHAHDTVATKGAPEAVADLCHLPPEARARVLAQSSALADQGLRVLGVAQARHTAASDRPADHPEAHPAQQHDFDFSWLGLVALADPLRADVPPAVAQCRAAGIRVLMITGDHPRTAQAIARQAGLDADTVITGDELQHLSPQALRERVAAVSVYARMKPQQKLALVEALKARGDVVAMTGDGVNDAPALKAAHVGIAMGQRGSDVAREAAALVLLQDDFASIAAAIARGRLTFDNLRRALVYTIAVHLPIVTLAMLPVVFGLPLVLAPAHIAFLELVIDPACSLVFEAEAGDGRLMSRPPRAASERLMPARAMGLALTQGGLVSAAVIGLYVWLLSQPAWAPVAAPAAFSLLVVANVALLLPSRAAGLGWGDMFSGVSVAGRWVMGATLLGLAVVCLWPAAAQWFNFRAMPPSAWLVVLLGGLAMLLPLQLNRLLWSRWGTTPAGLKHA
jgi:Ca2+-transporting ATPase